METVDSTVVNVTEGPSPPEDVKESLELDVDTFSVRVVEDDSSCTHRKATSQLCSPHVQAFIQQVICDLQSVSTLELRVHKTG